MNKTLKLIGYIIGCELVGILGTPFTIANIPTWYANLNKPIFSPPNWVFGPVWTILYFLMGISFYLIDLKSNKKKVKIAARFFLMQLGVNLIWSPIFFGLKQPLLGLMIIFLMWTLIVITMKKFYPISKIAFYLLVPYLVWVSFATILNASIVILNH